jgi:hypothetical protein
MVISGSRGDWDPRLGIDEGGMGKLKRVFEYGDVSASSLWETEKIETRSTASVFGFSSSRTLCNGAFCACSPRDGLFTGDEAACLMTLEGGGVKVDDFVLLGVADPPMRVA